MTTRRNFLKATEPGIASVTFPGMATASVSVTPEKKSTSNLKHGVASYTLKVFSPEQVIAVPLSMRSNLFNRKKHILSLESNKDDLEKALIQSKEIGISLREAVLFTGVSGRNALKHCIPEYGSEWEPQKSNFNIIY